MTIGPSRPRSQRAALIGTPRGLTNGGERWALGGSSEGGIFRLPVVLGLLAALAIFIMIEGGALEGARTTLALAGVAVVAAAGVLILRFR